MNTRKPIITIIDPIQVANNSPSMFEKKKLRVAAYARVSTEEEEQQSSYDAQISYYTEYIKSNPDWEFVKVYSDEGISGTSFKNRPGFNMMLGDALDGKIDRILVKSISRFARNVVDSITTTRMLKSHGETILFEKENIDTGDSQSEIMLSLLSTLAQEESRSISENVKWGKRKSMSDGKVSFAYSHFLGYDKDKDGNIVINEEQAEIVRRIYSMFLDGHSLNIIAETLTNESILTPAGKSKWQASTVRSILSNEKYKGDALLQKTYIADYLSKKIVKNNGELPQYYIKGSHPAIIDEETFEMVQEKLAVRSKHQRSLARNSEFSTKIICESCGNFYGRKQYKQADGSGDATTSMKTVSAKPQQSSRAI